MGVKHNYTATGTNDGTKQISVTRWNDDHTIVGDLDLPLSTPVIPPADNISIFGKKIGGRMMLAQVGPSGVDTTFQPNLGGNKVNMLIPIGNSAAAITQAGLQHFGIGTLTTVGTATVRTATATNFATRLLRLGYVTAAATAGSMVSTRETLNKYTTGGGANAGGFYYRLRFVPSDAATVAGARFFAGLWTQTTAATNIEPNTLTNALGICQLSTSTNLHVYAAGASASTAVDLGINFPANGLSTDAYEFSMFANPAGVVTYQVDKIGTAFTASGTFASVPTSTVFLGHQIWKTNNATALATAFDICSLYIETDN